ncbi:hypothetical protein lerEdw1_010258, partial [Lerista edwardsae]
MPVFGRDLAISFNGVIRNIPLNPPPGQLLLTSLPFPASYTGFIRRKQNGGWMKRGINLSHVTSEVLLRRIHLKKMGSANMCQILASGILLLLTLLGDPTVACMCAPSHPQSDYCEANIVIKAKFLKYELETRWWARYEIQTTEVIKGPAEVQRLRFLRTASEGSLCGYDLEPVLGEDYVITAMQYKDRVLITLCSFIQPWAKLSPQEKRGLRVDYKKGCSCT